MTGEQWMLAVAIILALFAAGCFIAQIIKIRRIIRKEK